MPLGIEVRLGPSNFVFDGSQLPEKKGTASHPILAQVYCGQTAGWMKVAFSKCHLVWEVDLGPDHIVLDGDPASPRKGHSSPAALGPCHIVATVSLLSYTAELLFVQELSGS